MERLERDGIVVRPLATGDLAQVERILREPSVARWWGEFDRDKLERKARGEDQATAFAIELDSAIAGLIQYYEEDNPDFRHAGIDIVLATDAQGRGVGPAAIRLLAEHLLGERGHHRLVIDPAAANEAAIRAYEKVGFRRVGVMREYWRGPDGRWHDGVLMDLLASELRT
jgi:aminoglycoside 6'-N-acetyltransferase